MRKEKSFTMAQQKKLSIFLLFVIVLQNIDNANTKECAEGTKPVKLLIQAEYRVSSVREDFRYFKDVRSTESFKSNYDQLAVSASVSASGGGFSGSASASYEGVTESALSFSNSSHVEKTTMTKFDPDQNQIIEVITTTLTIGSGSVKTVTQDILETVDEKKSTTLEDLRNRAEEYISYNYGDIQDGKFVNKNQYEETTCVKEVGMCTGNFLEQCDATDISYGIPRPPTGTKCVEDCVNEKGRWGSSWCFTSKDEGSIQWGAGCVPCSV